MGKHSDFFKIEIAIAYVNNFLIKLFACIIIEKKNYKICLKKHWKKNVFVEKIQWEVCLSSQITSNLSYNNNTICFYDIYDKRKIQWHHCTEIIKSKEQEQG